MTPSLETRQLLHPFQLEDARQVRRIFPVWGVVEFLNDRVPWPFPADGVHTYYRDQALPAIARGEEWHGTLRLKAAPEQIIGSAGVHSRISESNRMRVVATCPQGYVSAGSLPSETWEITSEEWHRHRDRAHRAELTLPR